MIDIEQHIWGATAEGEAVIIYTLRNERGVQLRVCNYGAGVVELSVEVEGRRVPLVLGYDSFEAYLSDAAAMGRVVGRLVGRVPSGRITVAGEEHGLDLNGGVAHIDGGAKGFANRLWESRVETNRVVFSLLSPDGEGGYPAELGVEVIYDLDDDNKFEITYLARADAPTVVNLSSRIFWNLAGQGDVLDHKLRLFSHSVAQIQPSLCTGAEIVEVSDSPLDFRSEGRVGDAVGSDAYGVGLCGGVNHLYINDQWQPNILSPVATLSSDSSHIRLEVHSSQMALGVDSGAQLQMLSSARRFANGAGVAFVPQSYVAWGREGGESLVEVQAEELYCQKTMFKLIY